MRVAEREFDGSSLQCVSGDRTKFAAPDVNDGLKVVSMALLNGIEGAHGHHADYC